MAREVLSNGVINPDKYQADWYADLSNNWNLLNNLIGSAISGSEVDSKIATAVQELMVRTFQIVAELPETGTEGVMYLVIIPNTSKYTAYVWENSAYRELGVIQMTITIDDELSTTSENPAQNKVITNALNGKANISHTHTASDITSGLATVATSGSYNDLSNKPTIPTVNDGTLTIQKNGTTVDTFTANSSTDKTVNITVPTKTSDLTNDSGFITSDNTKIPLAGTNALAGSIVPSTNATVNLGDLNNVYNITYSCKFSSGSDATNAMALYSGSDHWGNGGALVLYGGTSTLDGMSGGEFALGAAKNSVWYRLIGYPNGTLIWTGQPIQYTSDQRLKQQITEIDDKLLDAWEDVNLVQFKYNDAVDSKSDKARLHTGFVVQQIDEACKSHNVDISEYGLYCHEEYPQEVEDVEVEQEDGTKAKEKKVIRAASEHYSLRYTEALIVECAYLRKCIKELRNEIEQLKSSK